MTKWQRVLGPILTKKIEEAINQADDEMGNGLDGVFPWLGEDCYGIISDAAICVLRGIQDAQDYLEREGQIES